MHITYPETFEAKIGFDHIRQNLAAECLGEAGRKFCLEGRISTKPSVVKVWQDQSAEYGRILSAGQDLIKGSYPDLAGLSQKLEVEGAFLFEDELHEVRKLLHTLEAIYTFNRSETRNTLPTIAAVTAPVQTLRHILARINFVLDDEGQMRDTASSELQRIRRRVLDEQRGLRRKLETILRQAQQDGYAPDGSEITVRGGRLVIPIVSEYKRRFKGFVHDESATGQTVFMEPADVLEANNTVRELGYEARREVQRILQQVTSLIRDDREQLRAGYQVVSLLDFIRAKARFGQSWRGVPPEVSREGRLSLNHARNPVLAEVLIRQGREVTPLDIELSAENRILVISGPNAGGKSVALKTTGLMCYMAQFGLPLPCRAATVPVFEQFFIDIGDDQSIENDLSTYSSHLGHMRTFMEQATSKSLILIDEFGTGTDPAYGGPIAMAVLEELNKKQVYGVVTTHYSGLKDMASAEQGMINGSMRFDVDVLAPLYQLQIGKPGSSFAIEIAQKNGLPKAVLANAKSKVGRAQTQLDQMLVELEAERTRLDRQAKELREQVLLNQKLSAEYEQIRDYLEENRRLVMKQTKLEAQRILEDANKQVERTIREIREAEADKDITKLAREELADFAKTIRLSPEEAAATEDPKTKGKNSQPKAPPVLVLTTPIQEGDAVRLKGTETVGTVESINGNQVRIQIGAFSSTVKAAQLEKVEKGQATKPLAATSRGIDVTAKLGAFSHQIDLRGLYAGDAMAQTEQYIDDALLLGAREVRIVHGKGNGILKTQVRNLLKHYNQVERLEYDHADRGGEGVTVVTFK